MQVQAVLFDLFNTLIMIEPDEVFYIPSLKELYRFLSQNGIAVSFDQFKTVYFQVRNHIYESSEKTLEEPHFNVRVAQTLQKLGYNYMPSDSIVAQASKAFTDKMANFLSLDPEAEVLLKELHGKYKLGVVTNFALPEFAKELLQKCGLARYFDAVIISGEVNRRKPSPEIFRMALQALHAEASSTVFVGDTLRLDIKGAKNVGIKAVLIERKIPTATDSEAIVYMPPDDGTKVEPDGVIQRLTALPSVLKDC